MQSLPTNQYVLEELFDASTTEVFEHLSQIGSAYSLGCDSAIVSATTPPFSDTPAAKFGVGFTWREHRQHLFLRDVTECEVTYCQAPLALRIVSNDGEAVLNCVLRPLCYVKQLIMLFPACRL